VFSKIELRIVFNGEGNLEMVDDLGGDAPQGTWRNRNLENDDRVSAEMRGEIR
jgi:hypothetical protein